MSARDWKPGDVAIVSDGEVEWFGLVRNRRAAARAALEFAYTTGGYDMVNDLADGFTARPLVVIDPEDREQVERLAIAYTVIASARSGDEYRAWENRSEEARDRIRTDLAAALREFANPTPPKPDEPTGLGAVVEDERGRRFVRIDPEDARFPWVLARDPKSNAFNWTDFGGLDGAERITVISEGVS